jgi:non-specific protein-tyrosine kinase
MGKLQKALEKAKEVRGNFLQNVTLVSENPQDSDESPVLRVFESRNQENAGSADVSEKTDWVSPSYSQSRNVSLSPEVMERNRCVAMFPNLEEVETYRVLRTQILNLTRESGGNLIMITSALPGEGKTLTAINLAFTFAREFKQTVLLVDCDLKKQSIHDIMGIKSDKGLVDHLLGDCPASDLFIWPAIEKLTLISGGKTVTESSEIMGSPQMKEMVTDMKNRYPERYIFFDVPAILSGADALTFAPLVDHILVVVQADKTPIAEVNKATQLMPREKLLGLVLNRYHP